MSELHSDPGPRPKLAWLPVYALSVDQRYQRSLDSERSKALITRIAASFRWTAFQAILAAPAAPGAWLVLDGQHRVEAARRVGIAEVPAVVVAALSLEEQAAAFVRANLDRVAVNHFALHHARVTAGDDAALALDRVCREAGLSIPRYPIPADKLKPGQTLAHGTIAQLIRHQGEGGASAVLTAIAEAWHAQPGFIRAAIIRAVAKLAIFTDSPEDRERTLANVTRYLERISPSDLFMRAAKRRASYGGTEADSLLALIRSAARPPASTSPSGTGFIQAPSRAQLMGRR
jgi:ParB-like chromosome segregation protein Spo0J